MPLEAGRLESGDPGCRGDLDRGRPEDRAVPWRAVARYSGLERETPSGRCCTRVAGAAEVQRGRPPPSPGSSEEETRPNSAGRRPSGAGTVRLRGRLALGVSGSSAPGGPGTA
ncbi:hypothetical protein NDU88_000846 [Pleurodeles waltl]|uniref:Uncharacterized protein n=1 Tax=Pleurodeles waltl TaxID=8319 RepID=A0AAV7S752_PLEWA|nr:hypothetical protein NDU88_000846 [Pleurodeles waltl]